MDGLFFVRVTDGKDIILFPASRIEAVYRTDREWRNDIVKISGTDEIYECYDALGSGEISESIIKFTGHTVEAWEERKNKNE